MTQEETEKYMKFAKQIAAEAGVIMQQYYRLDQQIEIKVDSSPVTIADHEINQLLIQKVQAEFPEHGVIGEEASWHEDRNIVWVCDPIDGTSAFIQHIPVSMFSLALVVEGVVMVAIAYNPWVNDIYSAQKGVGVWRNNESLSVSDRTWGKSLRLVGSGSPGTSTEPVDQPSIRKKLYENSIRVSNPEGAVFKGCLIAEGSLDGRIFMHSGAHDIAALKLIIEEAGGKVTDLAGNEQRYDRPLNGAVLSNGVIHEELLRLVQESRNHANTGN